MKVKKYQTRNVARIMAVFILSLIFWTGSVVPTQAAGNLGITVGSTSGQAGSQVSVNVNLSNVAGSTAGTAGLVSTNFAITYDPSVLQVTQAANVTPGPLFTTPSDLAENITVGKIVFLSQDNTGGDNPITTDGVYATIKFNILQAASAGDTTIGFAASPLQADSVTSTYTLNSLGVSPTSGKVTVTGVSSAKDITGFTFAGLSPAIAGTINGTNISATVPAGTNVTALVPTITVSPNASITPGTALAHDFTNPVTYTVTAQDGSTQTYTVTVTAAVVQTGNLGINIGSSSGQAGSQVSVNVNLSNVAGSTAGTAGLVSTNFAITYDPSVLQVTQAANVTPGPLFTTPSDLSENITAGKIVFLSQDNTGGDNPITTDGVYATIKFNILQTASAGDTTIGFAASPLQADSVTSTYTLNSLGVSPTSGKVTVTGVSSAKDITGFTFAGLSPAIAGTINGTNITAVVPAGTNVTALVPTLTVSPNATVAPASTVAQNFTNPEIYTVTAQDGTTQTYTVTVTVAAPLSSAKSITGFTFAGLSPAVAGTITGTSITATVPAGTSVTALVPTITVSSNATINPASAVSKDFSNPVSYTVTAQDGTTQTYTVTVTVAAPLSSAKSITGFTFAGLSPAVAGTITGTSITATVPAGTSVTALVPTITVSPNAMVAPASAIVKDFTNPVTYTVTAQDGTTQAYTVTVTGGPLNKTVSNVVTLSDINVANGTTLANAGLPSALQATLNDGSTQNVSVTWDGGTPAYSATTNGTYTFIGTLTMPTGVTNPTSVTATVRVIVTALTHEYGNLNGDHLASGAPKITSDDALVCLQIAARLVTPTDEQAICANVDGDYTTSGKPKITSNDALLILKRAARLISKFPVEP